jgi:UDP-N-acetylglucosamine--N-acetylmuramyl-(pentapeptide) pyrophosphoryl-undecaprenol N-acetylglucosamine transferase
MKIILTGGGTGGHFYPIIAVAEKLNQIAKDNRLLKPELYYMSTDPYDENLLFENSITFYKVSAGKIRRDKTPENLLKNFFDLFKTFLGVLSALWRVFVIYPDVVFGKGGYASFPVLFAARFLRIPVVIHESDSKPGKVNAWAGKFARRVAVSYPDAASYFKKEITAYTGNPVRKAIQEKQVSGSHEFFGFNKDLKTVFVIGGSLGSRFINSSIMDALSELVDKYQVIHQTGKDNYPIIEETSKVILNGNKNKDRYKAFPYMNDLAMRMASGAADVIISRAGSAVFEIALWGRASILVPIPEETSHDQRTNAYSYARSGACFVIEEKNMSTGVLMSEIERVTSMGMKEKMEESAKAFSRADSAQLIAEGIISIGLEHEK